MIHFVCFSSFRHPNIISLLGLVVHGDPKMVVLEYMDGGDLQAFLQQKKVRVKGESKEIVRKERKRKRAEEEREKKSKE